MKKALSIILALVVILLLTACGVNNDKLAEYDEKIAAYETKIQNLEKQIAELNDKIDANSEKYTITKEELIGKWLYNDTVFIEFTENNFDIYGNAIVYHRDDGDAVLIYQYVDGHLYFADDGPAAVKETTE